MGSTATSSNTPVPCLLFKDIQMSMMTTTIPLTQNAMRREIQTTKLARRRGIRYRQDIPALPPTNQRPERHIPRALQPLQNLTHRHPFQFPNYQTARHEHRRNPTLSTRRSSATLSAPLHRRRCPLTPAPRCLSSPVTTASSKSTRSSSARPSR